MRTCFALLLAAAAHCHAAQVYTETFSIDNDVAGWQALSTGVDTALAQDPLADLLTFTSTDFTSFFIIADASASGGVFSGDLLTAGITGLTFRVSIAPGSAVDTLFVDLLSVATNDEWQYALPMPVGGVAADYEVPLAPDAIGWTQVGGSNPFSFTLANADELALGITSAGTGRIEGTLDNVATIPEPGSAALLLLGVSLAGLRRFRRA